MDMKKENIDQPSSLNSPVAPPDGRKKRNKRRPLVTSTPSNSSCSISRASRSGTTVLNDTSSLFSIDERLATLLKQLKPLLKTWESKCSVSCDAFTRLSTCIVQCHKGKLPDELQPKDMPVEAIFLIRHGQHQQARKISQGFAIERGFSEVQQSLHEISECGRQIVSWSDRLSAVCALKKTCEPNSNSTKHSALSLIFWPAIQSEARNLVSRIDKDLAWRHQMVYEAPVQCANANSAYRLVLLWRHLGELLRYSTITSLVDHVITCMEQ